MATSMLCAIDEHSEVAVKLAANMARAMGANLTILSVNVGSTSTSGVRTNLWDGARLKSFLEKAVGEAQEAGAPDPTATSVEGHDAASAIVAYADDHGIDHIVVGTGGKGLASRLMLGSVSRDVVLRAHCSVTVAR